AKTATGSSIALKMEVRPPPTFGTAMASRKIGIMVPKNPSANPNFHSPSLINIPFHTISGDKKMLIIIRAKKDVKKVLSMVAIPSMDFELICRKIAKLKAEQKPKNQPCQRM